MEALQAVPKESNQIVELSVQEMKSRVVKIQRLMKEVMIEGVHFGTIPGCGDKPTLLKPGAEKLCMAFMLAPKEFIEDLSTDDEKAYRVTVHIYHAVTNKYLGFGVGECSSGKDKYLWRAAVCDEEFTATDEDQRRLKWKREYGKTVCVKQVKIQAVEQANTVLKMAKKSALVDAVLTVCAASDIFYQDIEDIPEEVLQPSKSKRTSVAPKAEGELLQIVMPFGEYKGKPLPEVPTRTLESLRKTSEKNIREGKYVKQAQDRIAAIDLIVTEREPLEQLVEAWKYRKLGDWKSVLGGKEVHELDWTDQGGIHSAIENLKAGLVVVREDATGDPSTDADLP